MFSSETSHRLEAKQNEMRALRQEHEKLLATSKDQADRLKSLGYVEQVGAGELLSELWCKTL
jgi:hypothetical protein